MALSLSHFPVLLLLLLPFGLIAHAATVTYDWNITWVHANPDKKFTRPTIGINNQWPLPHLNANVGDRVIVNVLNELGNQSTSLHFHGLFQNGTTHMDGVVGGTQCAIVPGQRMTYNFTVDQPGTYWYHSHERGQYPDGLRGPLIVHDPKAPFAGQYDEELVLTMSDWYHDQMPHLISKFLSVTNPFGGEPVPRSALFNDTQDLKVLVEPKKTYLLRIINIGAFAGQYLWFEGHSMTIVEIDGVYTVPKEADMIYLTAAQRYSVLLTTSNITSTNFAFVGSMDLTLFDKVPKGLNPNVTGWLVYEEDNDLPSPTILDEDDFVPLDDFTLVPLDGEKLLDKVDHSIQLDVQMENLGDGANYAFFNDITYVMQKVPTLYTALTTGKDAVNPLVYGVSTNPHVLKKGDVVELIVNNNDAGKHPFHLHGHNFQVVVDSKAEAGLYNASAVQNFPEVPMRRDVAMVHPNGNIVLRFRADNPGVWMFHCHLEWHVVSGLVATMIEAPEELQKSLTIPADHLAACKAGGIPTSGNAVGNTQNFLDLTGQRMPPKRLPKGFTARGVVILVSSILAALIGMVVISWYGMGELGPIELEKAQKGIAATQGAQ